LANFAIGCDNSTPAFLARTRYYNVVTDFHPAQGVTVQIDDSLFNGVTRLGYYAMAVTLVGNSYHVEFLVTPSVTTYLWRLQTIGTGLFHLWANKSLIGTSSSVLAPLPGGFSSPNYRFTDTISTITSGWQCSDKVITVGNFSNRAQYLDKDSVYINLTDSPYYEIVGNLVANSSVGPTRDGRIKPDITATGNTTTATGDSTYIALLISAGNGYKVSYGSKHTRNGGTSMSSPIVAGVSALYLQEHPTANYAEVKQVLQATAKHDVFTTTTFPTVSWGWGKVNAYQALIYHVVYGCMDTGSFNYNPLATIDTGGCIPKVYGCTDTGSINYNPLANTNNGSCIAKVYGIMDTSCLNFNPLANVTSGVCTAKVYGIMDTSCFNYNSHANVNSGACTPKVYGITDTSCFNYNSLANVNSGVCTPKVYGITDTSCFNYNSHANVSSGVCTPKVYGITDTSCFNYNSRANTNSGVCTPKIYGVTDTACLNYDSTANVNSGVCIPAGIKNINSDLSFDIIPNPFSHTATIQIESSQPLVNATVRFYDLLGKIVDVVNIPSGITQVTYKNNKLAAGIYQAAIVSNGQVVAVRKVVVE
jgi:hypothetical protein